MNQITQLEEEPHLNSSFKHFIFFSAEFDLLNKKEIGPMAAYIKTLNAEVYSKFK